MLLWCFTKRNLNALIAPMKPNLSAKMRLMVHLLYNVLLLICNTDPHYKPGTHWIAIYVDKWGRREYFDSFGMEPTAVFKDYMNNLCRYWTFNPKQLQSVLSSFCGHYCCFYCVFRSSGYDMRKVVSMFTSDTAFNDVLVHNFVCR